MSEENTKTIKISKTPFFQTSEKREKKRNSKYREHRLKGKIELQRWNRKQKIIKLNYTRIKLYFERIFHTFIYLFRFWQ